jgi:hypothetical protein
MSKYYENINKFLDLGIALAFERATMLVILTVRSIIYGYDLLNNYVTNFIMDLSITRM